MQDYVDKCIARFCELTGYKVEDLKFAETPFVDESKDPLCVLPEEFDDKEDVGELSSIACKVLMQLSLIHI